VFSFGWNEIRWCGIEIGIERGTGLRKKSRIGMITWKQIIIRRVFFWNWRIPNNVVIKSWWLWSKGPNSLKKQLLRHQEREVVKTDMEKLFILWFSKVKNSSTRRDFPAKLNLNLNLW
jgi:hypothetical protein